MSQKVALLLGAGATLSDVATRPKKHRPPLDKDFFALARSTHLFHVNAVRRYMSQTYDLDITAPGQDSLEGVMGQIYTDLFNPLLKDQALRAFRSLIRLFNGRLATTTNGIQATNKRLLYRLISGYISKGVRTEDLTIITFNQDIQVEKILKLMSSVSRWQSLSHKIFNFPNCYQINVPDDRVTAPTSGGADLLAQHKPEDDCIKLLKLHGSLNWYSRHTSLNASPKAMFDPKRRIYITRRMTINPDMKFTGKKQSLYTLPVIIPPVSHKSAVLHDEMAEVWRISEERLSTADELVIFGYSCPALDFESSNQLRRSQIRRSKPTTIHLIDPDSTVATRYISLLGAKRLHYYSSAHDFLGGP